MPNLRHFDNLNTARAVNFSCYHRMRLLTNAREIQTFLKFVEAICEKNDILIYGYVVMPNHVHLVLHPPDKICLGVKIGEMKSRSARAILRRWRTEGNSKLQRLNSGEGLRFWQKRCYDHNCRTPETVREKIHYCHNNPVTAGIVNSPGEWPWSSYNWYQGHDDVPLAITGVEL